MSAYPRRGTTFVHRHFLDLTVNGSTATTMKVTSVRKNTVYYTYATDETSRGAFKMPLENWLKSYGDQS